MDWYDEQFRSMYKTYRPLLRVIAKRRGIVYDELDDIVQETFTAFYDKYRNRLSGMDALQIRKTLSAIARNRCTDVNRRKKTHPLEYFDPVLVQDQLDGRDEAKDDILGTILKEQQYQDIMDVLRYMKKEYAEVFIRLALEGCPVKQFSEEHGLTREACRTRLYRAKEELRKSLEQYRPDDSEKRNDHQNFPGNSDDGEIPENA